MDRGVVLSNKQKANPRKSAKGQIELVAALGLSGEGVYTGEIWISNCVLICRKPGRTRPGRSIPAPLLEVGGGASVYDHCAVHEHSWHFHDDLKARRSRCKSVCRGQERVLGALRALVHTCIPLGPNTNQCRSTAIPTWSKTSIAYNF